MVEEGINWSSKETEEDTLSPSLLYSTTFLTALSLVGFFILYGIAVWFDKTVFNKEDIVWCVAAIGALFGFKKWQRKSDIF